VLSRRPDRAPADPYIQKSWAEKPYGRAAALMRGRSPTDSRSSFAWVGDATEDGSPGTEAFADGAVVFPVNGDPPLVTMGRLGPGERVAVARRLPEGRGATRRRRTGSDGEPQHPENRSLWKAGHWAVVFSRALHTTEADGGGAEFTPASESKVAFAVWNGSNGERAGIKAFSQTWLALKIEG
jgi:complex iron-sulfur molybdoenzyme family reductase subunit gamma